MLSGKFSATSHGKGVVDGVGGRVKSIVHTKVMSLRRDRITVQDAKSFYQLVSTFCDKTTVIHVMADEIDTYKSEDPFANSVPIEGIYCSNACDQFKGGDYTLVAKFKT